MNINNLFNKTDIEYTFSLESYIDSLNNDYDFNDYKIKVSNKTYDELSIESDRLYNEINNLIIDYDKYSIEGILDKIKDLGKWIVEFIKKIIHHLEVIGKMILSKIYEWTIRDKENLYNKFEKSIFTGVHLKIKDRKLNPNLIIDCIQFMSSLNRNLESFDLNERIDNNELNILVNNISNLKEQRENKEFLDYLFYADKEVKEMTIGEYFDCRIEESPKLLTILSPEYLKLLKENKNNTDKLIKKLKIFINEINKNKESYQNNKDKILLIRDNILILYNANYTFFIKSIQVRKKVGKYICKASLNKLLKVIDESIRGSSLKSNNSSFKKIDDVLSKISIFKSSISSRKDAKKEYDDDDWRQEIIIKSSIDKSISLHLLKSKDTEIIFYISTHNDEAITSKNLFNSLSKSMENNIIDLFSFIDKVNELFQINIPKLHMTAIISSGMMDDKKLICSRLMYSQYYYKIEEKDIIFHASDSEGKKKSILSFSHGKKYHWIKYSEQRIYGGLNAILSRNMFSSNIFQKLKEKLEKEVEYSKKDLNEETKITKEMVDNFRINILDVPIGTIVYDDPEKNGVLTGTDGRSIYIPTDNPIRSIDLTPYIKEIQEIY